MVVLLYILAWLVVCGIVNELQARDFKKHKYTYYITLWPMEKK